MLNLAEEPSSSSDESIDESSSSSYVHERSRSLLSEPSPATPPTSESPPATSPPSEPSNTTSPPGSNAPPPPPPPPSPPPPPPSELQSELDWGPELKSSSPPPSKNTPPPSPTQTLSPPPPPLTPSPPPPPSPSPPHSPPPHSPPPSPPYSPPPNPVSTTSNLPSSPPQLPSPSPPASSVLPPPSPFPSPPPPALYEQLATPLTGTPLPPQNTSPQPITSDRVNPLSTSAISSNPPSAPETLGSSPTGQLAPPTPSTGHPSIFNSAIPNLSIPNGFKPPSVPSISTPAGPQIQSPTLTHSNADTPSVTSSNHSSNSSSRHVVIGATVTGLVIISMLVFVIFIKRKRKKGGQNFAANYHPAPSNIIVQSDGYYYVQHLQQNALVGRLDGLYNGRPLPSPSTEKNNGNGGPDSGVIGGSISCFNYEDLMEVTNGFSKQNVIGEGGFGCVYKGWLADGRAVAVKQLKAGSGQGEREFRAEVEIISRVHHRHLVSLVGYCIAERHRLLVYEFLPNNNLDHHLHGKGMPVLEWSKRLKIALGAARGLAYLHDDCNPKIIHRDIKSANILLDDSFEAQVADFGLAKLTNDNLSHVSTRVVGTIGYMAPEYASSGKLTDRSDVYSFGVVLLELVTGRKSIDSTQPLGDESLVEWARPLLIRALDTGDFKSLIDPRLESRYVESEMVRMIEAAAACVRHSASKRPRMVKIVRALDSEGDIYDLTNGLRVGQSTTYDSAQYSVEIKRFRKMAFGSWESSNYDMFSGEFGENSSSGRSLQHRDSTEAEFPSSSDSESQLIDPLRNEYQSNRYKPR